MSAASTPNPHASPQAPAEFARDEPPTDLTPMLKRLLAGAALSAEETAAAFEAMMTGRVHHSEMGALLALLATRTPTGEEILGAARVMRAHVDPVTCSRSPASIVDTAGTGGAPKAFNVSTAAAIVAAAAGAVVAKHGNRSRTGRGSAEVLNRLGVNIDAGRATQQRCLDEVGVCFCFAIHHHPATKHVMPVRQALGFPTIFNLLGPLTNPAGARRQVMGVYDARFLHPTAEALRDLGTVRAMVVHSDDRLDELSISAPTRIVHVEDGSIREETLDSSRLGLRRARLDDVVARDLDHAVRIVHDVLNGADRGPCRDMALLSAAATLVVAGVASDVHDGLERAAAAVDTGTAADTLARLAACSHG